MDGFHSYSLFALLLLGCFLGATEGCGTSSNPTLIYLSPYYTRYIKTPNYPSNYDSDFDCYWRFSTDLGSTIGYSVSSDFSLEYSSSCVHDSLSLYDSSTTTNLFHTYCGTKYVPSGATTGRYLLVRFKSDGSRTFKGFKMAFAPDYIPSRPSPESVSAGGVIIAIIGGVSGVIAIIVIACLLIACCCCGCCNSSPSHGHVIHHQVSPAAAASGNSNDIVMVNSTAAATSQPAPQPVYYTPPPGYQCPPPGYQGLPPPGYQGPPPEYQGPPPEYQDPPPEYQGPPPPEYKGPPED